MTAAVLARLRGVKGHGPWTARCPAHEDRNPSLSITEEGGRTLVHCHAGCPQESVIEAIGKDLFGGGGNGGGGEERLAAEYEYRNADGGLAYTIRRYERFEHGERKKRFQPYLPNATTPGLNGGPTILYRLPQVVAEAEKGKSSLVVLAEGEKAVDCLVNNGFTASTNPFGSSSWKPEYAEPLQSIRHIVVLPDNDEPGRKWAEAVVASLDRPVRIVHLPGLPESGDVVDWFEAGGTVEQLQKIVRETRPSRTVEVDDDLAAIGNTLISRISDGMERGWHWAWPQLTDAVGLIMPGRVYAVTAFSGQGKSATLRSLALGLLELKPNDMGVPGVAYMAIEETGTDVLGLMSCALSGVDYRAYGQGRGLSWAEVDAIRQGVEWIQGTGRFVLNQRRNWTPVQLMAKIAEYVEGGVSIVMIDHAHLLDLGNDERNRDAAMGSFVESLSTHAKKHGYACICAVQPRKPSDTGVLHRPASPDEIRGTARVWNAVENVISPFRPWVVWDTALLGEAQDEHGHPRLCHPNAKPKDGEQWEPRLSTNYTFIQPSKARIGGDCDKPVVLRFNAKSGRIT